MKRHLYFNTSHVSINPGPYVTKGGGNVISIHLMFLLIGLVYTTSGETNHFNTSHVSINPQPKDMFEEVPVFQYISCFY